MKKFNRRYDSVLYNIVENDKDNIKEIKVTRIRDGQQREFLVSQNNYPTIESGILDNFT